MAFFNAKFNLESVREPLDVAFFFNSAALHFREVADDEEDQDEAGHTGGDSKEICEDIILSTECPGLAEVDIFFVVNLA